MLRDGAVDAASVTLCNAAYPTAECPLVTVGNGLPASNDGSATTFDSNNFANQTLSFVDSANDDYHLVNDPALNSGERGKRENLITSFTTDVDGDPRPATGSRDIGADQVP